MTCHAGSDWALFVIQLSLDFVDQLLALDLSGFQSQSCLLVFSVAVVCDCPQTVRQLLVCVGQLVLFDAGPCLELS